LTLDKGGRMHAPGQERESWIGMQPDEDEAVADCDCRLVRSGEGGDDPAVYFCPLHERASDLLDAMQALMELVEEFYGGDIEDAYRRGGAGAEERRWVLRARKLLAAIRRARAAIRKARRERP